MKITTTIFYGRSRHKAGRLGMAELFFELQQIIFDTEIEILESMIVLEALISTTWNQLYPPSHRTETDCDMSVNDTNSQHALGIRSQCARKIGIK